MSELKELDRKACARFRTEPEVSAYADQWLRALGYDLKHTKTGDVKIDRCWPSKKGVAKGDGLPDLLVYLPAAVLPFCVWENKSPRVSVAVALDEAKFYLAGLHSKLAATPGLPRLAAGFNGLALRLAYYTFEGRWVDVKVDGRIVIDAFPHPEHAVNGFSANGTFNAAGGKITRAQLRAALPHLKTLYRNIPVLASGRRPIDFTVALLTLKMLVESQNNWGTWAEQPALVADAKNPNQAIGERLKLLVGRVMADNELKVKYGDIFEFRERVHDEEVAFNFLETLKRIDLEGGFFTRLFEIVDALAPLHGAEFDLFGEVYQSIGDDATKRALGEFFTGRHIIAAVVPILMERAGMKTFAALDGRSIADIACGTGGFLTETLRYVRRSFNLDEAATRQFAEKTFFGYDLSPANASRARVNMYFAGDGFSAIEGNVDTLANAVPGMGPFSFILTNPPYGASSRYQRLEESFLARAIELLVPGTGWGLIVLPIGVLENPRSSAVRLKLLRETQVTDVISLPMHAFAPYTKQRTAIVVFQRRSTPRPENTWTALINAIGHESVKMFIVDNDGYANSDKRYETARIDAKGRWEHDDLREWTDKGGLAQPGKLFAALIYDQAPSKSTNEFGDHLGPKYTMMTIQQLAKHRSAGTEGINLLPDVHLRPRFGEVSFDYFVAEAEALLKEANGGVAGIGGVKERARRLLATRIARPAGKKVRGERATKGAQRKIEEAFVVHKGTTGLTEAVIYTQAQANGLAVYGGGESPPRFFISPGSRNNAGKPVVVHEGPALVVSLDGSSGAVRVVEKGRFVLNHHGCVLKIRNGEPMDLYCAAQQIEGGIRELAANKDASATLTMPKLKGFAFAMPDDVKEVQKVAELRAALESLRDRF